jgi:RNA polymerase sigma factor (sigma-70 family)
MTDAKPFMNFPPMQLMPAAAAGPSHALDDLSAQYQRSLWQFAHSLTRCEADAWDLTQQTFLTFATKGHQLRDPSKIKTWMFTTLHRTFLQVCRRQARFPHCELNDANGELPQVSPGQFEWLDSGQALAALEELADPYRAPVSLFYMEDLSYQQIADKLGIPLGTVKSRIARGLEQLRRKFEPL